MGTAAVPGRRVRVRAARRQLRPAEDPESAQTLRLNLRLLFGTQLTASATLTKTRDEKVWTGFAGLSIVIGHRGTTVSATHSRLRDSESDFLDISKSLPLGPGIGYRLTASDLDGGTAGGQFEVNTAFNRMRLNYDTANESAGSNASATLSGGLSATRAGVYLTRPLDSSVAVVEVEGLKGGAFSSTTCPSGAPIGAASSWSTNCCPTSPTGSATLEEDIPFDFKVPASSQLVAPPFRGAAYVKFPTARIQAREG